ncbi:Sensor histidine kinase [Minicystis rosea]|nr:Sensor histidine kinase [Minicystis rosea]
MTMVDDTSPAQWWTGSMGAALNRRYRRSRSVLILGFMALGAAFIIALAMTGYPAWRVAVTAIITVIQIAVLVVSLRGHGDGDPRHDLVELAVSAVMNIFNVWITGGLDSPALLALLIPVVQAAIHYGAGLPTLSLVGLFVVSGTAMAIVPAAWLGPPMDARIHTVGMLGVLILVIVSTVDYVTQLGRMLGEVIREMVRAREEAASQAMTRARDLELLSSKLSHELKNPLGAVKALVQVSARATTDPEQRERLAVVESEVDHLHAIMKSYLSFSRPIDSLHLEPFALGEVLDDVLALLEARAAAAGVRLQRAGDAQLEGDPRRIKEALFNLVANAVEATPRKGEVVAQIAEQGGFVEVTIRDTGRGMAPDVLSRVGTPFFTTREQGTGLGVLLARTAFTQHGGSLELSSAPGRGTIATGRLPIAPRKESSNGARAFGG